MAERPRKTQLSGAQGVQAAVNTILITVSNEVAVWRNNEGSPVEITKIGYTPDEAVTGNTTNNFTLQAKSKVAAGTAKANITAVKVYATGVDIAQFAEDLLVLSATIADRQLLDGEMVTLDKAETAGGLAMPAGLVTVEFKYI